MQDTLAQAFEHVCAGLNRIAGELGAESAAVLLNEDARLEVSWHWNSRGTDVPARQVPLSGQGGEHPLIGELLFQADGVIEAATPVGRFLRETISPLSEAFLLCRWHIHPEAVAIAFGFSSRPAGPPHGVREHLAETVNAAGLAILSAREIARLRMEVKSLNGRLTGRKLIERAKGVLQHERGISEESAYEYLRGQSRRRRITLTKLAEEVVRLHGAFGRSQCQ